MVGSKRLGCAAALKAHEAVAHGPVLPFNCSMKSQQRDHLLDFVGDLAHCSGVCERIVKGSRQGMRFNGAVEALDELPNCLKDPLLITELAQNLHASGLRGAFRRIDSQQINAKAQVKLCVLLLKGVHGNGQKIRRVRHGCADLRADQTYLFGYVELFVNVFVTCLLVSSSRRPACCDCADCACKGSDSVCCCCC